MNKVKHIQLIASKKIKIYIWKGTNVDKRITQQESGFMSLCFLFHSVRVILALNVSVRFFLFVFCFVLFYSLFVASFLFHFHVCVCVCVVIVWFFFLQTVIIWTNKMSCQNNQERIINIWWRCYALGGCICGINHCVFCLFVFRYAILTGQPHPKRFFDVCFCFIFCFVFCFVDLYNKYIIAK